MDKICVSLLTIFVAPLLAQIPEHGIGKFVGFINHLLSMNESNVQEIAVIVNFSSVSLFSWI